MMVGCRPMVIDTADAGGHGGRRFSGYFGQPRDFRIFHRSIAVAVGIEFLHFFAMENGFHGVPMRDPRLMRRVGVVLPDPELRQCFAMKVRRLHMMVHGGRVVCHGVLLFGHDFSGRVLC